MIRGYLSEKQVLEEPINKYEFTKRSSYPGNKHNFETEKKNIQYIERKYKRMTGEEYKIKMPDSRIIKTESKILDILDKLDLELTEEVLAKVNDIVTNELNYDSDIITKALENIKHHYFKPANQIKNTFDYPWCENIPETTISKEEQQLLKDWKLQICNADFDFGDDVDWESMFIGFALGKGYNFITATDYSLYKLALEMEK